MSGWEPLAEAPGDAEWPVACGPLGDVVEHLAKRIDQVVRWHADVVQRAMVPPTGQRPKELDFEVAAAFRTVYRLFLRTLAEGRAPSWDELEPVRSNASVRAAEGFELHTVLWGQHLQARAIWRAVCEEPELLTAERMQAVGDHLHRFMAHVIEAAVVGRREGLRPTDRSSRQAVLSALLEGLPARGLAAQVGMVLENRFTVLAVRIGAHPDELIDDVAYRTQAGWRKVRRLEERVERLLSHEPLFDLGPRGGIILEPTRGADPRPRQPWPEWSHSLTEAAAAQIWTVRVDGVATSDVPAAVGRAREAVDALVAMARPPGLYHPEDALLDILMLRAARIDPGVGRLVADIADEPDLVETLSAYIAQDGDRRATAQALFVHPNTVDNRLGKIQARTGFDPRTTAGLMSLHLALIINRLATAGPAADHLSI